MADKTRAPSQPVEPEPRVVDQDRRCPFCQKRVHENDPTKTRVWKRGKIIAAAHKKCVDEC